MIMRTAFFLSCFIAAFIFGAAPSATGVNAAPIDKTTGGSQSQAKPNKVTPNETMPIEKELNKALRRSFSRAQRRRHGRLQNTRITVTHSLSAPLQQLDDETRAEALEKLRKSLYAEIAEECRIISEAFDRRCHLSNLSIRPSRNNRLPRDILQLDATATYTLEQAMGERD